MSPAAWPCSVQGQSVLEIMAIEGCDAFWMLQRQLQRRIMALTRRCMHWSLTACVERAQGRCTPIVQYDLHLLLKPWLAARCLGRLSVRTDGAKASTAMGCSSMTLSRSRCLRKMTQVIGVRALLLLSGWSAELTATRNSSYSGSNLSPHPSCASMMQAVGLQWMQRQVRVTDHHGMMTC